MAGTFLRTRNSRPQLLLAVIAAVQWAGNAAIAEDPRNAAEGRAVLSPCQLPELSRAARCGVFKLLENPGRPVGRRLAINAAVVTAASGKALTDPIVVLMGGPGEDAISAGAYYTAQFGSLLQERDLLLVDQRGTGRSQTLRCDLYSADEAATNLQDFFPLAAVKRCAQQSRARADLSQYTYTHLAYDLEHIRRALGYGKFEFVLSLVRDSRGTGLPAHLSAMYEPCTSAVPSPLM